MLKKIAISALSWGAAACLLAYAKPWYAPGSDGAFLVMAAEADMTTAHLGQDAENLAVSSSVKDFGKTLAKDHTTDYGELTDLAAKTKDTIPTALDRQEDRTIAAVEHNKGKSFDHALLLHETADHEKLIRAFKHEAEHGSNPDIKAYADKALPVIERHLHEAEDLLKSAKG